MIFSRTKDEFETQKERWSRRKTRFRILVCIDGSEESYESVKHAAQIGSNGGCDIILLYVRQVDQGLRSGGLQVRVARQNMMEWGLDLPGIQYLKRGLEILVNNGISIDETDMLVGHSDAWGDPLGDNKIEYKNKQGQSIVLKLKTAPDVSTGILDQCELGPYNLMILGEPSRWRSRWNAFWGAGVVQKVVMVAPCSVLVTRKNETLPNKKGHLIYTDGSPLSLKAAIQDAVLAKHCKFPCTILGIVDEEKQLAGLKKKLTTTKEKLAVLGIKPRNVISCVGNPVIELLSRSDGFYVLSISEPEPGKIRRLVSKNIALKMMEKADISILNVR